MKNNNLRFINFFPYLIFVIFIAFLALRLSAILSKATDLGGVEQNVVYSVQVLLFSNHLYLSPAKAPFSITQYTPLYYYLCGFTAKLTGYNSKSGIQVLYLIGRTCNLVFNILTALLVFNIGRYRLLLSKNKSLFLFLLSFSFNTILYFAVRPDALCDLLGVAAINCFMLYVEGPKKGFHSFTLLFLTVFLSAAAVFSKQSGIQFILLFSFFCLFTKDFNTLIKIILISILVYGVSLACFYYRNPSFFENIIGGISNGISFVWFVKYILRKSIFIISYVPVILITVFLIFKNNLLFKTGVTERLLAVCVLGTLIFATVTGLKMGSSINYYMLFMNLSLLLIFRNIENKTDNPDGKPNRFLRLKTVSFFYFFILIFVYGFYYINILNGFKNPALEKQRLDIAKVADFVKKDLSPGKYIFANLSINAAIPSRQQFNNIFFRNCLVPDMDILEGSTAPSKVLGYNALENMIKSGQVEYIISSNPAMDFVILKNLQNRIAADYKLVNTIGGYQIYKFIND